MLKHGRYTSEVPAAETQFQVADAETRSCYTDRSPCAETQSEAPGGAIQNCHTVRSRRG
jgi:hypothetical protein